MRPLIALLGLGLWISGLCAAAEVPEWERAVEAARAAEAAGDMARALEAWSQALAEARRPPAAPLLVAQALEGLAAAHFRLEQRAEAEAAYLEAIAAWERAVGPRQPRLGVPVNNLAVLLLQQCRVEEARPWLDRLLELWPAEDRDRRQDRSAAFLSAATLLRRCGQARAAAHYEAQVQARER